MDEELLGEISGRLSRMQSIAEITRSEVLTRLRETHDVILNARSYLDEILPRVEDLHALIARTEVFDGIERMARASTMTEIETNESSSGGTYEDWSDRLDRDHSPEALGYCLLNMAAVVIVSRDRVLVFSPLVEAWFARMKLNLLNHVCNDGPAALHFIEDWLGLPAGEYTWIAARECSDRFIEKLTFCVALQMLFFLNNSLLKTQRVGDVLAINSSFLGFADYRTLPHGFAIQIFERHDSRLIRDLETLTDRYGPIAIARMTGRQYGRNFYLRFASIYYSLASNLQGNLINGEVALGAYFGLTSEAPMRFDILTKRLELHGYQEVTEGIEQWIESLQVCGRFEAAIESFRASSHAVSESESGNPCTPDSLIPAALWKGPDRNSAVLVFQLFLETLLKSDSPRWYDIGVSFYHDVLGTFAAYETPVTQEVQFWRMNIEPILLDELALTVIGLLYSTNNVQEALSLCDYFLEESITFEDTASDRDRLFSLHPLLRNKFIARAKLFSIITLETLTKFHNEPLYYFIELFFPSMGSNPDLNYDHFITQSREMQPFYGEFLLSIFANSQVSRGNVLTCRSLLERHLGLSKSIYQLGHSAIAQILSEWSTPNYRQWIAYHIGPLHDALASDPETRRYAAVLVEACLGVSEEMFVNLESARIALKDCAFVVDSPIPIARALLFGLIGDYADTGRPQHALSIVEALFVIDAPEQYGQVDWIAKFKDALSDLSLGRSSPMVIFNYLKSFVAAVRLSGDLLRMRAVAEYFDAHEGWLDPMEAVPTPAVYDIAYFLIDHFAKAEPDRAWKIVSRVVSHLRWFLATRGPYDDRVRISASCDAMRHRIVRLCYDQDANDDKPTDRSLTMTLVWDTLIGQLLLSERIAASGRRRGEWAGDEITRLRVQDSNRVNDSQQVKLRGVSVLNRHGVELGPSEQASPAAMKLTVEPIPKAARERLHTIALNEERLSAMLGEHRTLLRVGFAGDGRLVWVLYKSAGDELIALGRGVTHGIDARREITYAVSTHDEAIREAWDRYRLSIVLAEGLQRRLAAIEKLLIGGTFGALPNAVCRLGEVLERDGLDRYRKRLLDTFPTVNEIVTMPEQWGAFWAGVLAEALPEEKLEKELDRITASLLDSISETWNIGDVVAGLKAAGSPELLLQVDGALHGVPMAFLKHLDHHLFEYVPCIHSIFSLGVEEWLSELDRAEFDAAAQEPDRVLSISWLPPHDSASDSVAYLHRGHAAMILDRPDLEVYAAVDPPRTHATLARALATHKAFRVVSVCGHGVNDGHGVELGDGIWTGAKLLVPYANSPADEEWLRTFNACDIRGVELLIQVSCSVGRISQSEGKDAEGLCLELAVSGGRSVVAGRWPLHAGHAVTFANRLVGYYLDTRSSVLPESCETLTDALIRSAPRARAITAARTDWVKAYRAGTAEVGLNTVAAFDLYGRG